MSSFRLALVEQSESMQELISHAICDAPYMPPFSLDKLCSTEELLATTEGYFAPYDLVIYSLDLPAVSGCADFALLKRKLPLVSFIVYSGSDSLRVPQEAYSAGAAGFFRRDSPALLIAQIVSIVLGAEAFAVPEHLRALSAIV
ncbi:MULTISPECIES: hypothetical protein [unclassified Caballeronia]|uniref:hypothetical protein n=1 Tax=unclassified Caballeronia TaxID=2646786 RepID=UPI002027744D|nr:MULTISPECIES: hypothetical protein [unclassified Caballeronia]